MGCHALLQGNLPDPGVESMSPASPALAADSLQLEEPGKPKMSAVSLKSNNPSGSLFQSPITVSIDRGGKRNFIAPKIENERHLVIMKHGPNSDFECCKSFYLRLKSEIKA